MINNSPKHTAHGFSLIELMIAIVIGIILLVGIISIFDTSSHLNRTQRGLARIQENGRVAVLHLKHNIEQSTYQYCMGSSVLAQDNSAGVPQRPWKIFSTNFIAGMPKREDVIIDVDGDGQADAMTEAPAPYYIDPAYFIHGHECKDSDCAPDFTSLGTDKSFPMPAIGTADGNRLANTDILTIRYLSGSGKEIENINDSSEVNYTQNSIAMGVVSPSDEFPMIIMGCDNQAAVVVDIQSSTAQSSTIQIPEPYEISGNLGSLSRAFSLDDFKTMTYYVANNRVNGRSIATLYLVENGRTEALIEGVDRFDVLYGVQTISGDIRYIEAQAVDDIPSNECIRRPYKDISTGNQLMNTQGCGWRSVVSIEVHLLLNSVENSSNSETEAFIYSLDSNEYQQASDLPSNIEHYKMHRKEFIASIALKNY